MFETSEFEKKGSFVYFFDTISSIRLVFNIMINIILSLLILRYDWLKTGDRAALGNENFERGCAEDFPLDSPGGLF